MQRPLADEIRPKTLDEVVGQRHLLAPGAVLRRLIDSGDRGQHGVLRALRHRQDHHRQHHRRQTNKTLHRLNATTASLQDVKDIIADVGTLLAPGGILLYLDEIQYFNKKQQQSLLGVYGERVSDPHRLHHGEPILLCVRGAAVPQHGV